MSKKNSILIVDDDQIIRSLARKILDRAGYDTEFASNSKEALVVFGLHPELYNLVIIDYTMDGISGVDLAQTFRLLVPDVPIIMSSGERIDLDVIPPDLKSNTHILQKPYRSQELVGLVQFALAQFALVR
ncbi:MAG: response regulator [candidate division Zixibacteria bacterium]|nr:response regulator [candidate division Zixibacteria bacterium]